MPFHLEQPLWLLATLVALPMALSALALFIAMKPIRRVLAALTRLALIAIIALILAGVATIRETSRLAVIAIIDVSGSVQRQPADGVDAIERAIQRPGQESPRLTTLDAVRVQLTRLTEGLGPDDLLGIVAFDGRPVLVASPAPAATIADRPLEYAAQDGTNIADALSLAATLIPADATGRLLLVTDGVETSGDARAAARQIASSSAADMTRPGGLAIDVVPIRYRFGPEVIVESVDTPPLAAIGAPVTIRAVLKSTHAVSGTVRVLDNATPVDVNGPAEGTGRRIDLSPGTNVFVAEIPIGSSRVHRFQVVFEPDAATPGAVTDRLVDNNTAESFTLTPATGSVLLIDGVSEFGETQQPSPLAGTLREADISVTTVAAGAVPADLLSLQNYDLIILEDVPADAVAPAAQQALVAHVKDMGAGLLMVGGPMSFGAGGWKGSPIEPLLPVKLDLSDTLVEPEAAIVFVLDNSGSMNRSVMGSSRSQQEIANESAARAVLTMSRADLIGVIAFNNQTDVIVPLTANEKPTEVAARIREIEAGGGTNAGPALEAAMTLLTPVKAKVKHVILLSDGKSQNSELLPLMAAEMHQAGITVSTISVGDSADVSTMKVIAERGGGQHYHPVNPNVLPRIFLKAIRVARTPLYREQPFNPVITDPTFAAVRGLGTPPQLGGLNLTQPRPEPTIANAITTPAGEPVLSWWRYDLGQVAAFTSDAGTWAADWTDWPGYAQFWTQMARTLSRPTQQRLFQTRVEAQGDELRLSMEAIDESGRPIEFLEAPATLYSPSGEQKEITLRQSGSGLYETTARADENGTYVAVIRPRSPDRRFPPVIAGVSVRSGLESRRLEPDPALVADIAAASGGSTIELADLDRAKLFDRTTIQPRRAMLPLMDALLPWALGLLLLDIAMRRVAWDRLATDRPIRAAGAVRSLAERLSASPAPERAHPQPAPAAFTQRDAEDLIRAQRDRRIAERLAAARQSTTAPAAPAAAPPAASPTDQPADQSANRTTDQPAADETGLAAAKRRARRRFEDPS